MQKIGVSRTVDKVLPMKNGLDLVERYVDF